MPIFENAKFITCDAENHVYNAMAVDAFQKPILRVGETFDHTTVYHFSV